MRILFTGATGLAGRRLFSLLREHGHEVLGISRHPPRIDGFCQGDLQDPNALGALPNKSFDVLVHFASNVPLNENTGSWEDCSRANLHGTARLLEWADRRIGKIILASSCAVYGEKLYTPTDERHPLQPDTPYAVSKYGQEQIVQAFCRSRHLPLLVLRLGYVYGPATPENRIVIRFIKKALAGEPIKLFNSNTTGLNLIHQDDIARIAAELIAKGEGTYNLGSPEFLSLDDYVEAVTATTGRRIDVIRENTPGAKVTDYYSSDLWKHYRLKPQVTLRNGIAGILAAIA